MRLQRRCVFGECSSDETNKHTMSRLPISSRGCKEVFRDRVNLVRKRQSVNTTRGSGFENRQLQLERFGEDFDAVCKLSACQIELECPKFTINACCKSSMKAASLHVKERKHLLDLGCILQ